MFTQQCPAAEGFCFCIRKSVIESQGYLDEVYGKGYHEERDYSYRAITNGWKNVLIDDLYMYHKNFASFGVKQRQELIKENDEIFDSRWLKFEQNYIKENNLKHPAKVIEKELYPFRSFFFGHNYKDYSNIEHIFSIKRRGKWLVLSLFGLKIKWRNYGEK